MSVDDAIRAIGGNVNGRLGPNNRTILHAVILDDDNTDKQAADLVEKLLQKGADPDVQGDDGGAPLIIAAAQARLEVVRTLVRAKAKPWLKDKKGFTALHYAAMEPCNVAIIEALAAHPQADIDVEASLPNRPAGSGTALFIATVEGQTDAVRTLLGLGARADIPCCGRLARAVAVEKGHRQIVRLLDQPPEVSPSARGDRRSGHNVLRLSMDQGHEEGVAAMKTPASKRTQRQKDVIMTMASTVAVTNDVRMLELLLKKNYGTSYQPIDLASADFAEGFTILHDAAGSSVPNAECVQLLLDYGASPTTRSKRGLTPLDVAEGKCPDLTGPANTANARLLRRHVEEAGRRAAEETFPAGTAVTLRGLQKRPELNGRRGLVRSGPEAGGRLVVELDAQAGSPMKVLPANLERVASNDPEGDARAKAAQAMEGVFDGMQKAMLDATLDKMRTGDHEADVLREQAARLVLGTMANATRDGDHATMATMLSGTAEEKMRAVMAARENNMVGNDMVPPPGTGKNAAKNKKKREKERQRRAAGQEAGAEAGSEPGAEPEPE